MRKHKFERIDKKMKRYILTIIAIILIIGGGIWWWKTSNENKKQTQSKNNTSNYQAERSSINQNTTNNNTNTSESNNNSSNSNINTNNATNTTNNTNTTNTPGKESTNNSNSDNPTNPPATSTKETEIAQFSTKIYNKDSKRQNNITITCKALSEKEIAPGDTFSFCDTVGKATSSKGYQEADIYVGGEKKKGLGGGNCQVSSTLYNAVLKVTELEVVERHQHSGKVPYIQAGKDAAVAYGAYDFKFKNNTGNKIKIVMENTANNITARIIKL